MNAQAMTRQQVREVDRRAIEEFGLPGIVLMENAGRNATEHVLARFDGSGMHLILCGGGNNGGDGYVMARHLSNAGVAVEMVRTCAASRLPPDARTNHDVCVKMAIPVWDCFDQESAEALEERCRGAEVVVDALLGTGFSGDVRDPLSKIIESANRGAAGRIVAVDVPSGLDCDTGQPSNATIRAAMTVSFVAPKVGFEAPGVADYLGELRIADIGVPASLLRNRSTR